MGLLTVFGLAATIVVAALAAVLLSAGGTGVEAKPDDAVTICHKPGTPAEKTLTLPPSAVGGHLGHGDTEGACGGTATATPTETEPTATPTEAEPTATPTNGEVTATPTETEPTATPTESEPTPTPTESEPTPTPTETEPTPTPTPGGAG